MRLQHTLVLPSFIAVVVLSACAAPQDGNPDATPVSGKQDSIPAIGEAVTEIDKSCWAIFHDKDGNHWFGSDGRGVSRYDGKAGTITRFTTEDGLAHDQVRGITQHGPTGHILISTNGGISKFDGERFTTLPAAEMIAPTLPLTDESLKSAGWTLNDTDTWLPGEPGGPRRYDGKTLYQLKFPKSPLEDAWRAKHPDAKWAPNGVWHVYTDRRGHMWFGTGGLGVCRFDGHSFDWMHENHLAETPGGGWFGYRSIIEDKEGSFWICNTKYRFDMQPHGAAGQQEGLIKYQRKEGMDWSAVDTTDEYIYFQSVTQDNDGDLWMSPWMGGVWRHDGAKGTHYPMIVGGEEIKMISISTDNQGGIWVATHGHGPYRFNGTAFERFAPAVRPVIGPQRKNDPYFTPTAAKTTPFMPKVIIRNIREDRAGNIWFATFGGPIRYDGKDFRNFQDEIGLSNTRIFSLAQDRAGAIWFGSITGGASRYDGNTFTKFTTKDGLAGNDVLWIFEDRDGDIWLGTEGGVSRYDRKAGGTFTNFTTKDGLLSDSVYAIGQDAFGRIWFGTEGGICSYDGKSFSNFALLAGRTFTNIRAMAVDRSGNLWFGGEGGAHRYDGKKVTTFTSKDGLLDDFVGSIIVDRAGNVWLGHPGGAGQAGGASRYDGKSFKHFTEKDGLNSGNVYAMLEDKAGNIWFGSVDAGACRYDGTTFTNFSGNE